VVLQPAAALPGKQIGRLGGCFIPRPDRDGGSPQEDAAAPGLHQGVGPAGGVGLVSRHSLPSQPCTTLLVLARAPGTCLILSLAQAQRQRHELLLHNAQPGVQLLRARQVFEAAMSCCGRRLTRFLWRACSTFRSTGERALACLSDSF